MQLDLFSKSDVMLPEARDQEWFSGVLPDHEGSNAFVIMIRDKNDPQPPKKAERHADRDKAPHFTLRKQSIEKWRDQISALLSYGRPRTFNALCVVIAGLTADICGGETPERAIWSLVQQRAVEFTTVAPILFRATIAP